MIDITILVICYKQEEYLNEALQSAEDQVAPFGTIQAMPTFQVKSYIDVIGVGASAARNKAIKELVDTPWVIILDADDVLPSHYLWYVWHAKRLLPFKLEASKFVGSPVQFISGIRRDRLFYEGYHTNSSFEDSCPCASVTGLFSKASWQAIGGFDESMRTLNDWDFWLRLARNKNSYIHCNATFVLRRGSVPGSITKKGMSSEENERKILQIFNDKHGTKLDRYPQLYTIPERC
jgi:hypothetical protein